MGQLMAKLMGIFGKQGKGCTGHPSDLFDQAPTQGSRGDAFGNTGLGGSCVGAPCQLPSLPCPFPAGSSRVAGFGALQAGRRAGRASFLRVDAAGFLRL